MATIRKAARKSVKMTSTERKQFGEWVKAQGTKLDAAIALGVAPNTIDRLLLAGSGSEVNISKVRKVLPAFVPTAQRA